MNYFPQISSLLVLLFIKCCLSENSETVTISTGLRQIKGQILQSVQGQKFFAFRGIRYAKPPIESLRFEAPDPAEPWTGTYDATDDGSVCIQFDALSSTFTGNEDCLFLNVYRPQKSEFDKFPVMVFIHGGGYWHGTGSSKLYGPKRFMDKDITLVTLNYRLGPLGFLSTSDEAAPGNYGMLDQQLALQWVHDHISDFGGDPNSVTIFGESAGASSVGLHMLSPLSKGLFHAAIMQSGSSESYWVSKNMPPKRATFDLAVQLKCPTVSTRTSIDCLKNKSAVEILKEATILSRKNSAYIMMFRPTVDSVRGTKAFMPKQYKQLLLNGDISIVPTISGVTKDEGLFFYMMLSVYFGGINKTGSNALPDLLSIPYPDLADDPKRAKRAVKTIQALYFDDEDATNLTQRALMMTRVFNDIVNTGNDNANVLLNKRGCAVYPFKFTFRGRQSYIDLFITQNFISDLNLVSHADELQYLFHIEKFKDLIGDELKMSDVFLTLWTNFAKTKKPTLDTKDFDWTTLNSDQPEYLDLNLKPKMVKGYLSDDRSLWNAVEQYHERFHKTEL